jgi:hypothetical protein
LNRVPREPTTPADDLDSQDAESILSELDRLLGEMGQDGLPLTGLVERVGSCQRLIALLETYIAQGAGRFRVRDAEHPDTFSHSSPAESGG